MHWLVLAAAALAVAFYNVGVLSVWNSVFAIALKAVFLLIAVAVLVVGLMYLRQRVRR